MTVKRDEQHHRGAGGKKRRRGPIARFYRSSVRPLFSKPLSRFAALVVPYVYLFYMRFVWATSRVEGADDFTLNAITREHDGAVALLWHEEVLTVAYGYPKIGIRGHTLASLGESGEVITRMLELCGYVVFRGGSSSGPTRRHLTVLRDMIDHMRSTREVTYGITVDGSKGPAYRMKMGGIVIARDCGKPVVLVRTWYKRCLRLKTWDRMAVPLPFNVIRYYMRGPYHVPDGAQSPDVLLAFHRRVEDDLIDLAAQSYADMGQPRPANLVKRGADEALTGSDDLAAAG
jgi:lysophospholipid acyltransferase (LPLAT)-like uncharacterized protein